MTEALEPAEGTEPVVDEITTSIPEPEPDEAPADTADPDEHDEHDEPSDIGKARREAAKLRQRAKDAEAQRDTVTVQLAAQQRSLVDYLASKLSVHPDLLDAGGLEVQTLLDEDGMVDVSAATEFIEATAQRFRVIRGHQPNPAQGQGRGAVSSGPQLRDAFTGGQRTNPYQPRF